MKAKVQLVEGMTFVAQSGSGHAVVVDGELRVGYAYTLTGWESFLEKVRTISARSSAVGSSTAFESSLDGASAGSRAASGSRGDLTGEAFFGWRGPKSCVA